jgi:hypothetical protein
VPLIMAIKLRSRAPYTCRQEVAPGKPCAAYLSEDEGDVCSACAPRRIWPAADPLEPGELAWGGFR